MIAQVCADREFIGTVGQLYLFAAQEVALIEVAVVPGFVLTAGAGDKYSEIIFQRIAQIYRAAVAFTSVPPNCVSSVMPMSSCHFPLGTPTRTNPSL